MAVQPQYAVAEADSSGEAVFVFPDVPGGQLWIGTVTIPMAPASAAGTVNVGGLPVGPLFGPGVYGPYIAGQTKLLSLSISGLTPDKQYLAVWHADDQGEKYATWPGTVTTTVEGTVVIPTPVDVAIVSPDPVPVSGTVDVGNLPALAATVQSGQLTMTGVINAFPSYAATQGVTLSAPKTNAHPIEVGGPLVSTSTGLILEPGEISPLLPVANSDALSAIGTSADVLSFLVT